MILLFVKMSLLVNIVFLTHIFYIKVTTVRDFTQVFDAYAQFEEFSLSKRMEEVSKLSSPSEEDDVELELRLARFEHLMERRLLLLNSVLLRQNPHNVQEWHKRVLLYEGKPHEIINTYTEVTLTYKLQLLSS